MFKVGKSSIELENTYLYTASSVTSSKEAKGLIGDYFDYIYDDLHFGCETFEQAEQKMLSKAINIVLDKGGIEEKDISVLIGGDLNNQLACTSYCLKDYIMPHLGVFAACSTLTESLIIASILIDNRFGEYAIASSSSHNATAERQFRYPTEYGGQKSNTLTMTVTGAGAGLITSHKTHIKISKMTIGKVIDSGLFDPSNLGLAMAPAAADTLRQYLADFKVDLNSYDLILTGDLSKFGKEAFLKILNEYGIYLGNNYNDAGLLVYDVNNQNVNAGGSGCGCITVATFGYVYKALLEAKLNKVLIIATGALINPIAAAQNQTIPCIAHAVTLERVMK